MISFLLFQSIIFTVLLIFHESYFFLFLEVKKIFFTFNSFKTTKAVLLVDPFPITVALFILSVSVIAVYQTISSSTLSVYSLENRTLAREIANKRIALLNTIEKPLKPDVRKNEITFFGKTWRYDEEYCQTPMTSYLEFSMKIYLIESNQLIYETRGFLNKE